MRTISAVILAGLLSVAVVGAVAAQTPPDLAAQRAAIQKDRNAVVATALPLTTDQTTTFWPLYREYRAEMKAVGDRLEKLILGYAANYNTTLTDEQAAGHLKEFLAIQEESLKVRQRYAPRFSAILGGKGALRFYQIENKLDVILATDLVAQIPLAP